MRVTNHAEMRTRKRVGVPRSAVARMAEKALVEGKTRGEFSGSFRRYLDAMYHKNTNADNIRVWSGKVWIFDDNVLITMYNVPEKYRQRLRNQQRKENAVV